MIERIHQALQGFEYEIVENLHIVSKIKIHNNAFQFNRVETFAENGLSLDNIIMTSNGELHLVVSKQIGFPEINEWLIHSAEIDFDRTQECGYQTIYVLSSYQKEDGQFIIPNYQSRDYNAQSLLYTMLEQIALSKNKAELMDIEKAFNPFTAKEQGLNRKSAEFYIEDIKETSKQNYEQLSRLFQEHTVNQWIAEQTIRMDILKKKSQV